MLMFNEFEIANFVAVVDSVDFENIIYTSDVVLQGAMQTLFFSAFHAKLKFGC